MVNYSGSSSLLLHPSERGLTESGRTAHAQAPLFHRLLYDSGSVITSRYDQDPTQQQLDIEDP